MVKTHDLTTFNLCAKYCRPLYLHYKVWCLYVVSHPVRECFTHVGSELRPWGENQLDGTIYWSTIFPPKTYHENLST